MVRAGRIERRRPALAFARVHDCASGREIKSDGKTPPPVSRSEAALTGQPGASVQLVSGAPALCPGVSSIPRARTREGVVTASIEKKTNVS
jgi:hypothetical protein